MSMEQQLAIISLVVLSMINLAHGTIVDVDPGSVAVSRAGSVWDADTPDLAIGGATCYMSGIESESYWKMELTSARSIRGVLLTGFYTGELYVRIGNATRSIGDMRGHDANILCRKLNVAGRMTSLPFECDDARVGKIVSVSGRARSGEYVSALELCNVQLLT